MARWTVIRPASSFAVSKRVLLHRTNGMKVHGLAPWQYSDELEAVPLTSPRTYKTCLPDLHRLEGHRKGTIMARIQRNFRQMKRAAARELLEQKAHARGT